MGCGRSKEKHSATLNTPSNPEQDLSGFSFSLLQQGTLSQQQINTPNRGQGRASTPNQPPINPYIRSLASRPTHEQEATNTRLRQQRLDRRDPQVPIARPSEEQEWGRHPAALRQRANDREYLRQISLKSERSSLPTIRTSHSGKQSSSCSVRGASPAEERSPFSVRRTSAVDQELEQPYPRPSSQQSQQSSPPTGRQSPFASPQVQEIHLSSSSSTSSSSSQKGRIAANSPQSQPGGASPLSSSSLSQNRSQSSPRRTHCRRGCRCMTCRPQFYTPNGELTRVWSSPCLQDGCRCPICTEICVSEGHMLPKRQQCKRRGCECSTGCGDSSCLICRTAMVVDRGRQPLSRLSSRPSMPRINSGSSLARTSGSDERGEMPL